MKKSTQQEYTKRILKVLVLVTMDEATYLTISGRGAPGGPEFTERIGALYGEFTVSLPPA